MPPVLSTLAGMQAGGGMTLLGNISLHQMVSTLSEAHPDTFKVMASMDANAIWKALRDVNFKLEVILILEWLEVELFLQRRKHHTKRKPNSRYHGNL